MNKRNAGYACVVLLLMTSGVLYPQDDAAKQKPKEMQIEGEVVDLACFTARESRGEGHKSCATRCLTRGNPAGLVDKDGKVFVIIAPSPGYASYSAQTIRLSGNVQDGRISPKKMEAKVGDAWEKVKLKGGAPKSQ